MAMKGWSDLGVNETIYEEEAGDREGEDVRYEEESINSSVDSPSDLSSSPFDVTSLRSRVDAWSMANGCDPNVLIRVQGKSFRLHKDPLMSRSIYLRRRLASRSDLTITPPLKITPETFRLVADFCYGARIVVTPFNVGALRTAAELLEMTDGNGDGGKDLRLVTETSFRRFAAVNKKYIAILFRSCLDLLPEAETMAFLLSRCIEAFEEMESVEGHSGGFVTLLDGITAVGIKELEATVDSISGQLSSHDVVYQMVETYLKKHGGKMSEDRKAQLCHSVDCTKLSPDILVHAVQNPHMPLRFIIRAMLVEQLRTRQSFLHATASVGPNHQSSNPRSQPRKSKAASEDSNQPSRPSTITLGAILNRDAALRQSAQIRSAMAATISRIQSLEEEFGTMKLRLMTEKTALNASSSTSNDSQESRSVMNSGRSQSFGHYSIPKEANTIKRGDRRSASSLSMRFIRGSDSEGEALAGKNQLSDVGSPRSRKSIRERLISGLKSAFGSSNNPTSKGGSKGKVSSGAREVLAVQGKAFSAQVGSKF